MPYPSSSQAFKCLELCHRLSNLLRDIVLFRYDEVTLTVFILTADDIRIIVYRDGNWRFEND